MGESPRIAYIVSRWGEPTQTFVRREALAVASAGATVEAWSMKRPAPREDATAVRWLPVRSVLVGVVRAVRRNPRRVARLVWDLVRHSSMRTLPYHLWAAAVGVAWSVDDERHPTFAHCHFGWVSATATWAWSSLTGVPYSVVLHAFDIHTDRLIDGFTPLPLRAATQVFAISERDRRALSVRWGIDVDVLRMGVPASWVVSHDTEPRDPGLVVSVGSLLPKKGHADLLRALARTGPTARLVIVGEGDLESELAQLAAELGLADRVTLAGRLGEAEVRRLLRRATVFALACVIAPNGDRDGIPVAIMEAMALGAPVVTTALGAVPELVDGAGVLVPPGDVEAMAEGLVRLLGDPVERARLADAARRRISESWTAEGSSPKVIAVASTRT